MREMFLHHMQGFDQEAFCTTGKPPVFGEVGVKKYRSATYMFFATLTMMAIAIGFYSIAGNCDVQKFDQHDMNGALRFQAHKMLAGGK